MKKGKTAIFTVLVAIIMLGTIAAVILYSSFLKPNIKKDFVLYIPHSSTYQAVVDSMKANDGLINYKSFSRISKIKKYINNIKSGRYELKKGMNNRQIVNILISGSQSPIKVYIPSTRTIKNFCTAVAKNFEFTKEELCNIITNSDSLKKYGYDKQTFAALIITDTYEFYWNISADEFLQKMKKENKKFWNDERRKKAQQINLSPIEVSTLASIVQAEQGAHPDERPIIAGLYINRLKKGIALQADPTVLFAIGDPQKTRVYLDDTKVNSPYNTYIHLGLPPGPILIPEKRSIEAVLNYDKNNYLYMCAKDDFSGYHYFSSTLAQHTHYAELYHKALNKAGIR